MEDCRPGAVVVKEAGPNRHGSGRPTARLRQPRERGGGGASAQISGHAVQDRPPALAQQPETGAAGGYAGPRAGLAGRPGTGTPPRPVPRGSRRPRRRAAHRPVANATPAHPPRGHPTPGHPVGNDGQDARNVTASVVRLAVRLPRRPLTLLAVAAPVRGAGRQRRRLRRGVGQAAGDGRVAFRGRRRRNPGAQRGVLVGRPGRCRHGELAEAARSVPRRLARTPPPRRGRPCVAPDDSLEGVKSVSGSGLVRAG